MIYYETITPVPVNSNLIRLNYITAVSDPHKAAFDQAAEKWGFIITERLDFVDIDGEVTDQIIIDVEVGPIDGPGMVLGQAGPTSLRNSSLLTAKGGMEFDEDDLDDLANSGLLDEVVFHEMGHVIGIGTLWDVHGHLADEGTANSRFTGPNARREYGTLLGTNIDTDVPLETMMGPGSDDSHWAENVFDKEIMTPELDGINYTSRLTIASLEDLGYVVDYTQAETYFLGALRAGIRSESEISYRCCAAKMDPPVILEP